jgi:hypothetical protein
MAAVFENVVGPSNIAAGVIGAGLARSPAPSSTRFHVRCQTLPCAPGWAVAATRVAAIASGKSKATQMMNARAWRAAKWRMACAVRVARVLGLC